MRLMRSTHWQLFFLTAAALLMLGCGGHYSLQSPSTLRYASAHGNLYQGRDDRCEPSVQHRWRVERVQC